MGQKKILIFNPFGIGDVLFTTPLIRNLKEKLNGASITYLSNRRTHPLLKNNQFLDNLIVFEKDEWRNLGRSSKFKFLRHVSRFFSEIKKERFDVVFDLSLNAQYGFFLKMAGIATRIGYNFKKRGKFLTHKIDIIQGFSSKHVASYYLELLKFLNLEQTAFPFDIFIGKKDSQQAIEILKSNSLTENDFLVAVCPGSGDSWQTTAYFKRWPEENFTKLCEYLQKKLNAKILLFGSVVEKTLCDYIYERLSVKPLNLCARLSLMEFTSLLSTVKLVVTNDGGPFHIAQALKKKTIVFFGPVNENVYGPYPDSKNSKVMLSDCECRPCYAGFKFPVCGYDKKCLRDITVDSVIACIEQLAYDKTR